jgi:hypothetical protein
MLSRVLRKAYTKNDMRKPSTPWLRKLAAFLQLLSLWGETRVREQAVERLFSTACWRA